LQNIRASFVCIYPHLFCLGVLGQWVDCRAPKFSVIDSDLLLYSLTSIRCQCFESYGFLSTLVPWSSCTLNHVLFFEIPWSCRICTKDILSWPCLWLFSICSSVSDSCSFFLRCLHSSISFVHPFYWPCNPWISCISVHFPNQITNTHEHTTNMNDRTASITTATVRVDNLYTHCIKQSVRILALIISLCIVHWSVASSNTTAQK
jgi:hypothetical protein